MTCDIMCVEYIYSVSAVGLQLFSNQIQVVLYFDSSKLVYEGTLCNNCIAMLRVRSVAGIIL